MMRFDRAAPGEGMIIYSRVENGKAYLEFQFFLKENRGQADTAEVAMEMENYFAHICVYDMLCRLVLEIIYPLKEEELAKGMLLHPHVWRGVSDSYLYHVEVQLIDKRKGELPVDVLERSFPLCSFQEIPGKGYFLNDEGFSLQAVLFHPLIQPKEAVSEQENQEIAKQEYLQKALQLLKDMGANTICVTEPVWEEEMFKVCDEMGLVVWYGRPDKDIPVVSELLAVQNTLPTEKYYYYKACWSSEPFVYILNNSLKRQENGNYSLTVYSNQKKVALYAEGVLFEFQMSAPEFVFQEIPAKKYPLQLTVEAGECSVSVTFYDF
ncbi:MAG: hypothetical protein E7291_05665 [Lachnospiraceae bacterium]|nr:hypothetical protein [Lachnospiraceae bacterium]